MEQELLVANQATFLCGCPSGYGIHVWPKEVSLAEHDDGSRLVERARRRGPRPGRQRRSRGAGCRRHRHLLHEVPPDQL